MWRKERGTSPFFHKGHTNMEMSVPNRIEVWDLPTRIFHWLLALFVITNFFTGEDEGLLFRVHTFIGYAILALLLFRLGWGIIGGEHARFLDFIRPWSEVRCYLKAVRSLAPPRHVGHNPAGGWMVLLMLVTLLLIVLTGMMGAVAEGASIPFLDGFPRAIARAMKGVHEFLGNTMMVLVSIHLVGVIVEWGLTRDNLVRAMVDGTKEARKGDRPALAVGVWRALLLAVLSFSFAAYLIFQTRF